MTDTLDIQAGEVEIRNRHDAICAELADRLYRLEGIGRIAHLDRGRLLENAASQAQTIEALRAALRGMLRATDHWNDWEPGAKERETAHQVLRERPDAASE